jgi:uncharacterized protein with GYD domain
MPKYLIQASYTVDGIQGLLKDGGSKRKAAAEQAIKGLGGSIEAFYFAFGDADAVVIADAPDNQSAAKATASSCRFPGAHGMRGEAQTRSNLWKSMVSQGA